MADRIRDAADERVAPALGHKVDDHLGVGGRLEQPAFPDHRGAQRTGVGEVAVLRHRQAAECEIREQRLDVPHDAVAGRRIADMADRQVPREPGDHVGRVQGIADLALRAVHVKMLAVVGDDAGGLLSAVLQGVQPEGRQRGGIFFLISAPVRKPCAALRPDWITPSGSSLSAMSNPCSR